MGVKLTELSTELTILIASDLSQLDLLNIALVCKRLQAATESELYCEYHPLCFHRRSVTSFLKALLQKPIRVSYVKSLELPEWESLEPDRRIDDETSPLQRDADIKDLLIYTSRIWEYDSARFESDDISREDYDSITGAALEARLINKIDTYTEQPFLYRQSIQRSRYVLEDSPCRRNVSDEPFLYLHYFSTRQLEEMSFSSRFCAMLRAGVDDAYVVLLVGLLRNLRRLILSAVPRRNDIALPWFPAVGQHVALREFTAAPCLKYGQRPKPRFPLGFFRDLVQAPTLERCELEMCFSWIRLHYSSGRGMAVPLYPPRPLVLVHLALRDTRLTTFHYSDYGRRGTVTAQEIVQLLEPHQNALETLSLFVGPKDHRIPTSFTTFYLLWNKPFSSLKNFTRLKSLSFPTHMLESAQKPLGQEIDDGINFGGRLPCSLRELSLYDNHETPVLTHETIASLIEVVCTELLNLQSLTVEGRNDRLHEALEFPEYPEELVREDGSSFSCAFIREVESWEGEEPDSRQIRWEDGRYANKEWEPCEMSGAVNSENELSQWRY